MASVRNLEGFANLQGWSLLFSLELLEEYIAILSVGVGWHVV